MKISRRSALAALALGLSRPGAAFAQPAKPRTEGLFMCPCVNCAGKWLPNCGNPKCSGADDLRKALRQWEAAGKTDDEIVDLAVAKFDKTVVADPSQRVDKGSTLARVLYGVPMAALLLGGLGISVVAYLGRGAKADRPLPAAPAETSDEDAALVAAALKEFE